MSQNNCETCAHKQMNTNSDLHCYMFKTEPSGTCAQHTGNKVSISKFGNSTMRALILTRMLDEIGRPITDTLSKE